MDPKVAAMLPLHPKDYLVLFTLIDGERHGYGLVKEIEHLSDGVVRLDPSNLYRSLKRLINEGLVAETRPKPAPEAVGERRKYYTITRLGTDVVKAEASRLNKLAEAAKQQKLIGTEAEQRAHR